MAKLEYPSSESNGGTSRRALLRGLTIAPVAASAIASPWANALASLHQRYEDEAATIARTKEGRSISRFRYHNAERRWSLTDVVPFHESRFSNPALHYAGFVCQQALCAYLLDVGFADEWNAQHIKQDIAKALTTPMPAALAMTAPTWRGWPWFSRPTGSGAITMMIGRKTGPRRAASFQPRLSPSFAPWWIACMT